MTHEFFAVGILMEEWGKVISRFMLENTLSSETVSSLETLSLARTV